MLARLGGDRRVDLGDHRRHPRDEDPLLGRRGRSPSRDRPSGSHRRCRRATARTRRRRGSTGRPAAARGRHRTRGRSGRAGATPPRRRRSRSRRSRAGATAAMVDDADRQPAHRAAAELARLRPAAEQEQRVGDVAGQEVAVDGLEPGPPGVLDALRTRPRPPRSAGSTRSRTVVRLARDPEQRVGVVELDGGRARPRAAARSAAVGSLPQASATPSVVSRVDLLRRGRPGRTRGRP